MNNLDDLSYFERDNHYLPQNRDAPIKIVRWSLLLCTGASLV